MIAFLVITQDRFFFPSLIIYLSWSSKYSFSLLIESRLLFFSEYFRFKVAQLEVTVIEGRNLKKKDLFSESDPYVLVYLDDKKQKQKTTVIDNCKNPKWNQTFVL